MLPSEKLRKEIEEKYNIELDKYKWNDELKEQVFNIKLDNWIEDEIGSMEEVYKQGLNIGECGLTTRYLVKNIKGSEMNIGTCDILVDTKNSPTGNHAWTTYNGYVIDSTLMIIISEEKAEKIGYKKEKTLVHESAIELSEYDTYSNVIKSRKKEVKSI